MLDNTETTITEGNHIPDAVRRQSARADEIAREVGVANVPPVAGDTTDPVNTTVVETPPAESAPASAPAASEPDYKQMYTSLQGKYNSEIPALRAQVDGLQRVLATVQTPPPAPAHTAPAAAATVDPKDAEEFGPDLIAAARRWARAELAPEVDAMRAELAVIRNNTQTVQVNQARTSIMNVMDNDPELGDRWRVINTDPQFLAWLELRDPFSGHQRVAMLRDAFAAGDAVRTMAFFKAFITEHTVVNPDQGGTPAHTPGQPGTGGPTLADLAAPGRANTPPGVGAPADKRMWTNRDITAFYRDVQKGVFNGRDAEKQRIEQDIITAASEGRVR